MSAVTAAYWGIGLMVAGKVADNNEWFGEDFGKAMMLGGAALAAGAAFSPAGAGAQGGASAVTGGNAASVPLGSPGLEAGLSGAGAESASVLTAPTEFTGIGATEAAGAGATGTGAASTAAALEPVTTSALPAITPETAVETGFLGGPASAPDNPVNKSMLDKLLENENTPLAAGIIGGQGLSGWMQMKAKEEELREARDQYNRMSMFGVSNDGRRKDLDLNRRVAAVSGLLKDKERGYAT